MPGTTNPPKPLVPWPGEPAIWLAEDLLEALQELGDEPEDFDAVVIDGVAHVVKLLGRDGKLQLVAERV